METVFIEFLDQMYWEGYGEQFKEDNPTHFNRQLREFKKQHQITRHEKASLIYRSPRRGRKHS